MTYTRCISHNLVNTISSNYYDEINTSSPANKVLSLSYQRLCSIVAHKYNAVLIWTLLLCRVRFLLCRALVSSGDHCWAKKKNYLSEKKNALQRRKKIIVLLGRAGKRSAEKKNAHYRRQMLSREVKFSTARKTAQQSSIEFCTEGISVG